MVSIRTHAEIFADKQGLTGTERDRFVKSSRLWIYLYLIFGTGQFGICSLMLFDVVRGYHIIGSYDIATSVMWIFLMYAVFTFIGIFLYGRSQGKPTKDLPLQPFAWLGWKIFPWETLIYLIGLWMHLNGYLRFNAMNK